MVTGQQQLLGPCVCVSHQRVEQALFPGRPVANSKTAEEEPQMLPSSAGVQKERTIVSAASSTPSDTAELVRVLRTACASHVAALDQLVVVADKIRVKVRAKSADVLQRCR